MSLETWHTYGYGIAASIISTDEDSLKNCIDKYPAVKESVLKQIEEQYECEENQTFEEIYDELSGQEICDLYEDDDGDCIDVDGFTKIIYLLLKAKTGLPLCVARDHNNDDQYILMPALYPWQMTEDLLKIKSEEELKKIFDEALKDITVQSADDLGWGHQNIESWG